MKSLTWDQIACKWWRLGYEFRHLKFSLFALVKRSKSIPEDTVKKKNCGWNRYKATLHGLFSWRTELPKLTHKVWNYSKHTSKCQSTGLWSYPGRVGVLLGLPVYSWVKARSSLSTCKRNNCPTTCPHERHCGGRRRKYCTPIRDTITKYKIHVHFLFHKGARDFVKLI